MCPDKSILSAWFDGEVDNRWSEQISEHLKSCGECSSYVSKLKDQKTLLHSLPEPDFRDSLDRVKIRIREKKTISHTTRFWEKRIPIPLAAAAALVAAMVSLGTNVVVGGRNDRIQMANLSGNGFAGQVIDLPGDKIDEIFRLMESSLSDEFSSNSIMELPSDVSLIFNGESELVRTAGYNGSASP